MTKKELDAKSITTSSNKIIEREEGNYKETKTAFPCCISTSSKKCDEVSAKYYVTWGEYHLNLSLAPSWQFLRKDKSAWGNGLIRTERGLPISFSPRRKSAIRGCANPTKDPATRLEIVGGARWKRLTKFLFLTRKVYPQRHKFPRFPPRETDEWNNGADMLGKTLSLRIQALVLRVNQDICYYKG